MCGPNSAQLQGTRGRYLRTKPGSLFGRDRDLETPSTASSIKKIKGRQAVDRVLVSLKQRAAKVFMSGFFYVFFPLGRQGWAAAKLLTASSTPQEFNRHARVEGSPVTVCVQGVS